MRANSRPLDALFTGKMALSVFVSCIRFGTLVANIVHMGLSCCEVCQSYSMNYLSFYYFMD